MNGSHFLWSSAKRARRLSNWAPRLMLAEARLRALIDQFSVARR